MKRENELRIAVFHDLPSGGAKRCLFEFCKNLSSRGVTVDAYMPATANEEFLPLDEVVRNKAVFPASRDYLLSPGERRSPLERLAVFVKAISDNMACHKKIAEAINRGGYDLAFVHHSQFLQTPFILRYLKIPSVYFLHEPYRAAFEDLFSHVDARKLPLYRRLHIHLFGVLDLRNAHQATSVLANSRFSQQRIFDVYKIKADVCYLGVNTELFFPMKEAEKKDFVLSVGTLRPHKGYRFIIASLAKLSPEIKPPLVIVADSAGRGEHERLIDMAREQGVSLKTLVGIPDHQLRLLYNQARAVVYAPHMEPFGFAPIESMACGTPVVGVREGGLIETIEDGKTGFLVERDERSFSRALSLLLSNPDLARKMGQNGVGRVREKWSWEKSTDRLLGHFQRVLEGL